MLVETRRETFPSDMDRFQPFKTFQSFQWLNEKNLRLGAQLAGL